MENIPFSELIRIVNGKLISGTDRGEISGVAIDSRKLTPGDLFIPLVGEQTDGHRFIGTIRDRGCCVTLTENELDTLPEGVTVIGVESTMTALRALGGAVRGRYDIPVIAVTGSSGKTTTKDLIASVLSEKYKTLKTQGNFNSEFGVPQTLINLNRSHEAAVIEMGMDHAGEIHCSINLVKPHYAVITNIGTAHIELLGSQKNIFSAKMEITETLNEGDYLIVNGDDPLLALIEDKPYRVIRVGIDGENLDLKASQVSSDGDGVRFCVDGTRYYFPLPGRHNVYNALMSIWLGKNLGLSQAEIQRGLDHFIPSSNRMKIYEKNGITIIDDSYNANPSSMAAALSVLKDIGESKKRRIAVLGDMLELGDFSRNSHQEIGEKAAEIADLTIAVGEESKAYLLSGNGGNRWYTTAREAGNYLAEIAEAGDVILFKGSRGMHLEEALAAAFTNC